MGIPAAVTALWHECPLRTHDIISMKGKAHWCLLATLSVQCYIFRVQRGEYESQKRIHAQRSNLLDGNVTEKKTCTSQLQYISFMIWNYKNLHISRKRLSPFSCTSHVNNCWTTKLGHQHWCRVSTGPIHVITTRRKTNSRAVDLAIPLWFDYYFRRHSMCSVNILVYGISPCLTHGSTLTDQVWLRIVVYFLVCLHFQGTHICSTVLNWTNTSCRILECSAQGDLRIPWGPQSSEV